MPQQPTIDLFRLVTAIRDPATTMDDLTHMVGPSEFENERQLDRLRTIDSLWARADRAENRWGSDPEQWPTPTRDLYRKLADGCRDYENRYC